MDDKLRRDILKYSGVSIFAGSLASQQASADVDQDNTEKQPGEHTFNDNVTIINSEADSRRVDVSIDKVTPGRKNPTVQHKSYTVPGFEAEGDDVNTYGNIIRDKTRIGLPAPGIYEAYIKTDDGREETFEIVSPVGKIRSNEKLNLKIYNGRVRGTLLKM